MTPSAFIKFPLCSRNPCVITTSQAQVNKRLHSLCTVLRSSKTWTFVSAVALIADESYGCITRCRDSGSMVLFSRCCSHPPCRAVSTLLLASGGQLNLRKSSVYFFHSQGEHFLVDMDENQKLFTARSSAQRLWCVFLMQSQPSEFLNKLHVKGVLTFYYSLSN